MELAQLAVVTVGWSVPHESTRDYSAMQRRLLPHVQACSRWVSIGDSKGGGSYRSSLPEAKESQAPSQIPRSINPTNIYVRSECLCSKSTAPPYRPSKALSKPFPTKSKQNKTSTSYASSLTVSIYWSGRFVNFLTQPTII